MNEEKLNLMKHRIELVCSLEEILSECELPHVKNVCILCLVAVTDTCSDDIPQADVRELLAIVNDVVNHLYAFL